MPQRRWRYKDLAHKMTTTRQARVAKIASLQIWYPTAARKVKAFAAAENAAMRANGVAGWAQAKPATVMIDRNAPGWAAEIGDTFVSVSQAAEIWGVPHHSAYDRLQSLIKRGLVSVNKKSKPFRYGQV